MTICLNLICNLIHLRQSLALESQLIELFQRAGFQMPTNQQQAHWGDLNSSENPTSPTKHPPMPELHPPLNPP